MIKRLAFRVLLPAFVLALAGGLVTGQVLNGNGEILNLTRLWDGVDVALVDASGNLMVGDGSGPLTVDGTVTVTPPSNASTNVAQFGGTNISTGTGAGGAGIPRMTVSNDSSLAANQSVNMNQVGGTNVVTAGVAGTQAVGGNVANDVAITTNPLPGGGRASAAAPADVAADGRAVYNWLLRNGSTVVQAAYAGVLASTGTGASGTGTPRMIWATDSPGIKNEDTASADADPLNLAGFRRKDTNATMTSADGDYLPATADNYGVLSTSIRHPNAVHCYISSTAQASTVITGCAAPGAGLSIYITGIMTASSIATTTVNFTRIQSGTGGNCGAAVVAIADFYGASAFAAGNLIPGVAIKVAANSEVCFLNPGAGTRVVHVDGFIAP